MRVTVFTALVGETPDIVRAPGCITSGVRYVCLSDRRTSPFPYMHVPVTVPIDLPAHLFARRLKILADHPALGSPDVTLWHDAAFRLHLDPALIARQTLAGYSARDILALRHPDRTDIEAEATAIVRCGYADTATVTAQAAFYRSAWPAQTVLTTTGYLFRRRSERVDAFNAFWWAEVARWCYRDQMSVDYAMWQTGMLCHYLPGHYRDNAFAKWHNALRIRPMIVRPSRPYNRPPVPR